MLWVFATLAGFTQVKSQTSGICNSSALKPVFIQDFGTASSPTATSKAAPGSTYYTYGNVGTDGNYIITPFVQNANKNDWAKGGDHTGNTNGNMFLVNAGGNNSIYFREQLIEKGFEVVGDEGSPVVCIMLYYPSKVSFFSRECLKRGVSFYYFYS